MYFLNRSLFLFFCLSFVFSKVDVNNELWSSFEFNIPFKNNLGIEIEQQYRYDKTIELLYKSFTDISISYPILNSVDVSGKLIQLWKIESSKMILDLSELSPGNYNLLFLSSEKEKTMKIQVVK